MDKRRNHIIFWVGYFVWYISIYLLAWVEKMHLIRIFLVCLTDNFLVLISFYFVSRYVIIYSISLKKILLFSCKIICFMLFLVIIRYGLFLTYYSFSSNIFPTTPTLKFQISGAIIITNRFLFIAVPFYLFKKHISDLKEQAMIDRKQNSLKKSMLSSELLGLKNQINPHFLYNILNFLYAHSIPLSYKLSKSILILSEIMRYAIRENEDEHKVPFEKEVIYLKNYIELENLQRDEYSNIKLEINGNLKYRRIPPLTFQPILDKIFTHGKDITIKVNVEEDMISFSSEFKRLEKIDFATFPSIFENFNKDFFLKNNVYHSFNYNSDNQFYNLCLQIHS